jgi:hypothetical protein
MADEGGAPPPPPANATEAAPPEAPAAAPAPTSAGCQAIDDFHFGISAVAGIPLLKEVKWDPSFQGGATAKANIAASLDQMKFAMGGALWGDYLVLKRPDRRIFLAVGGEARFAYGLPPDGTVKITNLPDMFKAGWMLDVDPYVKFIYQAHRVVAIFLRAAPGFSVWTPDFSVNNVASKSNLDFPAGLGFNVTVAFGTQFDLGGGVGLLVEVGYLHRMVFGETSWDGQETKEQGTPNEYTTHAAYSDSFTLTSGMVHASLGVVF